jgi:hypothetical protein
MHLGDWVMSECLLYVLLHDRFLSNGTSSKESSKLNRSLGCSTLILASRATRKFELLSVSTGWYYSRHSRFVINPL